MNKTLLEEIGEATNHHEGLRENASLDVLVGPSPRGLMPAPEVHEIMEGETLVDEDWEALYGDADTQERAEYMHIVSPGL